MEINLKYSIPNKVELSGASGKIPLFPKYFYRVYNSKQVPTEWIDGDTLTYPGPDWSSVISGSLKRTVYEFKGFDNVVINQIRIFDYASTLSDSPLRIYAVDKYWQRVHLCNFYGTAYNNWVTFNFDPVEAKYLLFMGGAAGVGNYSTEFEVYGTYTDLSIPAPSIVSNAVFDNLCGSNTYEWNLFQGGGTIPARTIDANKLVMYQNLRTIRHYLEWGRLEGAYRSYRFNPEWGGGWHLDDFYQTLKDNGIEPVLCVQNTPDWMISSWPPNQRSKENRPHMYGKNPTDVWSYIEQAQIAYQLAARYGNSIFTEVGTITNVSQLPATANQYDVYYLTEEFSYNAGGGSTAVDTCNAKAYIWVDGNWVDDLVLVNSNPKWDGDYRNSVKLNLGTVRYMECGNENNKGWKTRRGYQTGREHAANLSAFYDGHKGTMGLGVGIKNADPDMIVTTCGTVGIDINYFQAIIDWSIEHRGYRPDGTPDVPFDVVNFHSYRNDGGSEQHMGVRTRGSAPEVTNYYESVIELKSMLYEYFGNSMPLILGETGYDINQNSIQKAIPIGSKTAQHTQGDWALRLILESGRAGVDFVHLYQLYDDDVTGNSSTQYLTSGIANVNVYPPTQRPVLFFLGQALSIMSGFSYNENISLSPRVDKWTLDNVDVYALWSPTENGSTGNYTLTVSEPHSSATLYTLNIDSNTPNSSNLTVAGSYNIAISETPVFVKIVK